MWYLNKKLRGEDRTEKGEERTHDNLDMVVIFCYFKNEQKIRTKEPHRALFFVLFFLCMKIRTTFPTIRTKFSQSEQNSHSIQNPNKFVQFRTIGTRVAHSVEFEQIRKNSHQMTIINLYLSYISDIYVYYNIYDMFLLYSFVLIIYVYYS